MKVGFIQPKTEFAKVDENVSKTVEWIKKTDCDLIVLPELFNTGYNFKTKEQIMPLAERADGETANKLQSVAKEKDMCIIAGIAEKDGEKVYNSVFMITPTEINVYRKTHLFDNEKNVFEPGNTGFNVFDYKGIKIGLMNCFDWFFPESARTLALKGAQMLAHPSNLILPYCPDAMVTRANENRVFIITCNRIGSEDNLTFIGSSQITGTKGEILYRASPDKEEIKIIDININDAKTNKRITQTNLLFEDRRPEMYELGGT